MRPTVPGPLRRLALALALCAAGAAGAGAAEIITNGDCLDCHSEEQSRKVNGKDVPLPAFDTNSFNKSIHGKLNCVDCHQGIKEAVHESKLPPAQCVQCHTPQPSHTKAMDEYKASVHGISRSTGIPVAAGCRDCHGSHDIVSVKSDASSVSKLQLAKTCSKCHVNEERIYSQSIHGKLLAKGDKKAPVCTDCHDGHKAESTRKAHYKQTSDERCGKCHQDRLENYHETYHGKALKLGRPNMSPDVAACYDCHGHHNVLPAGDPASKLAANNIVQTCSKCHEDANANFTKYIAHADHSDRENYPILYYTFLFMTSLLLGVFGFFGIHTLLWLIRTVRTYMKDPKSLTQAREHAEKGEEWFVRFTPYQRFLHFLVVTSFLLLVLTGMPLKFYYADWAKVVFRLLGGPESARALHHFAAIITFAYFGLHLAHLAKMSWRKRAVLNDPATGKFQLKRLWGVLFGPDSMIPTWQDVRDLVAHFKWFIGRGPKPEWDRWTYWERFDYFAVFWGVSIIGLSGLILWFPQWFTTFLPGWIINVAMIVHSDEALLAAGFIFTIHFFNTHFRAEKFPMDTVIFTGRVSRGELMHERKRWYDRLMAEQKLEDYRARDEWQRWKKITRPIGFIFFGLGIVLLFLIIVAMAARLI